MNSLRNAPLYAGFGLPGLVDFLFVEIRLKNIRILLIFMNNLQNRELFLCRTVQNISQVLRDTLRSDRQPGQWR
jgi:hypothetical protein